MEGKGSTLLIQQDEKIWNKVTVLFEPLIGADDSDNLQLTNLHTDPSGHTGLPAPTARGTG